jgi:hypothetical protein
LERSVARIASWDMTYELSVFSYQFSVLDWPIRWP